MMHTPLSQPVGTTLNSLIPGVGQENDHPNSVCNSGLIKVDPGDAQSPAVVYNINEGVWETKSKTMISGGGSI